MSVEIKAEDFAEWDIDVVISAGGGLFADLHDLMFHHYNEYDGWSPFASERDIPAVIAEVRGHIERVEAAVKKARKDLADVERNARLAARRRQRAEKQAANLPLAEEAEETN